jgi:hypothetical protein
MHFNGRARWCSTGTGHRRVVLHFAHHLHEVDGQRSVMMAYIRYLDAFARQPDGSWLFAERKLMVDWTRDLPV